MNKIFCLAAVMVALMLTGCKDYDSDIEEINDRLDGIENTKIATIQSQIGAINTSLPKLENANKELGTYITALQNSTSKLNEDIATVNRQIAELKQSPESNNTKIDSVIVLIEQVKSDIQSELFAINTLVENLQNKDTELNGKVNDLQKYVDDELSEMEDWSLATFGTLEKQNTLINDVATIKEQIIAINDNISKLESRVNEKITTDIASAVATLNTTIQGKVQEITTNYTAALATAKEDITSAYTSAISDASASLENSMKSWVNEQLKGYYTIAEIDSKLSVLRTFVTDEDEKLQGEISDLTEALANARNELTTAYTNAIKAAIEENNGIIDNKIAGQIATVNSRIDNEIAAINLKIANLQSQIDKNSADIAKLLARIQSVSYVPKYSDGKATVYYASVEFDFLVSPKSVVTEIAANYKNILAVKAVNTITRAVEFIDMPILSCVADSTNGVITITASAENLPETFFDGVTSASAALFISDGNINITSDYVSLSKTEGSFYDEIWYTSSDGQIVNPLQENGFGANVVSNTYSNGIGVIKFDGNVTSIGDYAFDCCTGLTSITIPNSVTSIGYRVFYNCTGLTNITIPNSVTSIGFSTFQNCTGLTNITIPNSVTSIGEYAFYSCTGLTSIYIKAINPPSLDSFAFYDNDAAAKIYVPMESVDAYKSADRWKDYADKIVGYDFDE